MTVDPLALADDLDRATARMLDTVAGISDERMAEPSLLPGWTRGHVVTHLARNADSLVNLLTWARTGVVTPQYASPEEREAGIEAGYARPADEQLVDLREACGRFARAVTGMPAEAWPVVLDEKQGSAARVVWRRLREVEVHHVDLAAGYDWPDLPEAFTLRLLNELVAVRPRDDGSGAAVRIRPAGAAHALRLGEGEPAVTVSGAPHELAAWLAGRSAGTALTVEPQGDLPTISGWM
jgi:maleylpyruvate isomerase